MDACQDKQKCLHERQLAFKLDTFSAWNHPCTDCQLGTARQMIDFVPEPGWGPNCTQCGWELPQRKGGGGSTESGLCMECSRRGNKNKGNRSKRKGVEAYWGYREMAHKIATREKAA